MIDEQQIAKALDDFEAAARGPAQAPTAGATAIPDPCGLWHSLRGPWDGIIQIVKAAGSLIPVAKRIAEAMERIRDLLNALCP